MSEPKEISRGELAALTKFFNNVSAHTPPAEIRANAQRLLGEIIRLRALVTDSGPTVNFVLAVSNLERSAELMRTSCDHVHRTIEAMQLPSPRSDLPPDPRPD